MMASFSPQAIFLTLGANDKNGRGPYRALFRVSLDQAANDDVRLALNQNQPLGNSSFITTIARVTGERRQARTLGLPRKDSAAAGSPRG